MVLGERVSGSTLRGERVTLRPLVLGDFPQWQSVRLANKDWLFKWEPSQPSSSIDGIETRNGFLVRCRARERERQLGTGYGYGIFLDRRFCGEINLSGVQRGPFQSGSIGYWIDESVAGQGLVPESMALLLDYAFEELGLHRIQVAIIPRNAASRRVVEKLGLREEGLAVGYLEINGIWEDHLRYAITADEWISKQEEWISKQ